MFTFPAVIKEKNTQHGRMQDKSGLEPDLWHRPRLKNALLREGVKPKVGNHKLTDPGQHSAVLCELRF